MIDTPELIEEQMKETKSQLSEKLQSLEQQFHVTDTVQTTRSAVEATAVAVQATADTVTGAMQSLSEACDVRRQVVDHPWMTLGGAAALGYIAHQLLNEARIPTARSQDVTSPLDEYASGNGHAAEQPLHTRQVARSPAETPAENETNIVASTILQLKSLAMKTITDIARESAAQAVPLITGYLTANLDRTRSPTTDDSQTESQPRT